MQSDKNNSLTILILCMLSCMANNSGIVAAMPHKVPSRDINSEFCLGPKFDRIKPVWNQMFKLAVAIHLWCQLSPQYLISRVRLPTPCSNLCGWHKPAIINKRYAYCCWIVNLTAAAWQLRPLLTMPMSTTTSLIDADWITCSRVQIIQSNTGSLVHRLHL